MIALALLMLVHDHCMALTLVADPVTPTSQPQPPPLLPPPAIPALAPNVTLPAHPAPALLHRSARSALAPSCTFSSNTTSLRLYFVANYWGVVPLQDGSILHCPFTTPLLPPNYPITTAARPHH